MKNLFDDQIRKSFDENLDSIHASDELKARVLARISSEEVKTPTRSVALTAIAPEYIVKKQNKKTSHIMWLAVALASASLILISSLLLNIFSEKPEQVFQEASQESIVYIEGNTSEHIARETNTVNYKSSSEVDYLSQKKRLHEERINQKKDNKYSYNSRAHRV